MAPSRAFDAKFRRVFDGHFDAVNRYCLRRLSRDDANDAAAQVFVVAWRKIDEMPEGEGALPWLYSIARYEVSTMRRAGRRLKALRSRLGGLAEPRVQSPEAVVVRRAEHEAVVTALWSLPHPDREVILLRSYEDLSIAQIAVVLGCSPEAAKKRLSRALKRLRKAAGLPEATASSQGSRAIQEGGAG